MFHYLSIVLAAISGIVLVPLYLRYIPVRTYGAWLASGSIVTWLSAIDPGLSLVLQQRTASAFGKEDWPEIQRLMSGGILLAFSTSFALAVLGMVAAAHVPVWLHNGQGVDWAQVVSAFRWSVIASAVTLLSFAVTAINQGLQSSLGIGLVYLFSTLSGLGVTVVMLLRGAGLNALAVGAVVRGGGMLVGNIGYLWLRLRAEGRTARWDATGFRDLLALSAHAFTANFVAQVSGSIDAAVLARVLAPEAAVVFSVTRKAPDTSRTLAERPALALMPALAHLIGAGQLDKARMVLARLTRLTVWATGLLWAGFLALNDDFVRLWVGPKLFGGATLNLLICMAFVVTVQGGVLATACIALGDIRGTSSARTLQGAVYVVILLLAVHRFGMFGAAIAMIVSNALALGYYAPAFLRLVRATAEDRRALGHEVARTLGIAGIVAFGFFFVPVRGWLSFLVTSSLLTTAYLVLLAGISRWFRHEASQLAQSLRKHSR